jgi:hypothetical protein
VRFSAPSSSPSSESDGMSLPASTRKTGFTARHVDAGPAVDGPHGYVRFSPRSATKLTIGECPLSAIKRHSPRTGGSRPYFLKFCFGLGYNLFVKLFQQVRE